MGANYKINQETQFYNISIILSLNKNQVNHNIVKKGTRAVSLELKKLVKTGVKIIIMDAIDQRDIKIIARAIWTYQLVTGSSALAMEFPPIWKKRGWLTRENFDYRNLYQKEKNKPALIIAGSCSQATMKQNEYVLQKGIQNIKLNTTKILENKANESYARELDIITRRLF